MGNLDHLHNTNKTIVCSSLAVDHDGFGAFFFWNSKVVHEKKNYIYKIFRLCALHR